MRRDNPEYRAINEPADERRSTADLLALPTDELEGLIHDVPELIAAKLAGAGLTADGYAGLRRRLSGRSVALLIGASLGCDLDEVRAVDAQTCQAIFECRLAGRPN